MRFTYAAIAFLGALFVAAPALAGGSCGTAIGTCGGTATPVPEPGDFAIFAGGMAALLIRRRLATRGRRGVAGDR